MCKNCKTLPRNLWIHGPDEFFQILQTLNNGIDDGTFIMISETHSLNEFVTGQVENPFKAELAFIIQCPECDTYFTCAYKKYKGAGFWNRKSNPF